MKKTADAVVIGGGIAGASTLYYLARMGLRDTVLLEKGELASGSTGDSAAMVRQHYSNEVSIRLVMESLRFFQGFADEFDGARVFNGIGWLFLCEPDAREAFEMVGAAPGVDGLYLAVGGSGHSFKLGPAIGRCLAELITEGRASTVDITPLRPDRFDDGSPLRSTYGGNRA